MPTPPYIGSVEFTTVTREPSPAGERVEEITRPGVGGVALREMGHRGNPYTVVGQVGVANATARQTKINAAMALRGTVDLTIADDFGNLWTNVAVIDVRPRRSQAVASGVGDYAGMTIDVVIAFECIDTSTS